MSEQETNKERRNRERLMNIEFQIRSVIEKILDIYNVISDTDLQKLEHKLRRYYSNDTNRNKVASHTVAEVLEHFLLINPQKFADWLETKDRPDSLVKQYLDRQT